MLKTRKFNWGILGCGHIAGQFATSISIIPNTSLKAVASRSLERADKFAQKFNAEKSYDSYEQLACDQEVDAIYIATTHNSHFENTMLCLKNNKAVLCEKPLTVNANEAKRLIEYAREHKIFLMEAFWSRFLPFTKTLKSLIQDGSIGEVRLIQADFGFDMPYDPDNRAYNADLAGGALLDVGVYPLNFAQMIFGCCPEDIQSSCTFTETGVDAQSAYIIRYSGGRLAVLNSAINVETRLDAWLYGSEGYIHLPDFFHAQKIHIHKKNGEAQTILTPYLSTGYSYEAEEVMKCIELSKIESEIMPLDESLEIMQIMDRFRNSWGIKYPFE